MQLDPKTCAYYGERLNATGHPASVEQARADANMLYNDKESWRIPVFSTQDLEIPTTDGDLIPIRIYVPFSPSQTPKDCSDGLPLMIHFHGGGFVMHNIASHDTFCRKLSTECACIVISVGYRLAPEHRWPACVEDGCAALQWAAENAKQLGADPEKLILIGDSAGAAISAAVGILSRDRENLPSVALQVLCYGTFDCIADDESDSMRQFGAGGYGTTKILLDWFRMQYEPQKEQGECCITYPGRVDNLANLPDTLAFTVECDPLRDDGEAFARRLQEAGNRVSSCRIHGMIHGFLMDWEQFDCGKELISRIAQAVKAMGSDHPAEGSLK